MNEHTEEYLILGLMSGSSLDGLDIAACKLRASGNKWSYKILAADTIAYSPEVVSELRSLNGSTNSHLNEHASRELGRIYGQLVQQFLSAHAVPRPDAIASHGHTIFHQPENGLSIQLGSGAEMMRILQLPVIHDFRMEDIRMGGQGAPLVPVCDHYLFGEYTCCINLGGIANISFEKNGQRIGYDICGANQLLNFLAQKAGMDYDEDGRMARSGQVWEPLLIELNASPFLEKKPPRSLDNQFVQDTWIRLLNREDMPLPDLLRTATEHIAMQISRHISAGAKKEPHVLVTGGGAANVLLMERIAALSGVSLSLPEVEIIHYKEALAMALMGALRLRNEPNFMPSVTGATTAVCGGRIEWPDNNE